MSPALVLTPSDLAIAASLIVFDAAMSVVFQLNLHWKILIATARLSANM